MNSSIKKYAHFLHLFLVFLCTMGATPFANPPVMSIRVDGSFEVEELVKNIFALGVCDNIFNVRSIGNEGGIGYFENGTSSIGFESGIVLSTGPIENIKGPNNLTDISGDFEDERGDPDLDIMVDNRIKDAVGIEFDFTPLDSFVSFRYVFASEEYCEFVGSIYNDVFGFFISGPGINGEFSNNSTNVALVPGTNDFVSINKVNHLTNSNYYISNELAADADLCNKPYNNNGFQQAIEFDGFTQALTAFLKLSPCETYHIRMVVADVGDAFYDSAVFLEAGSFNLGGRVDISGFSAQGSPDAIVFEGCTPGYIEFSRASFITDLFPVTVNFKVSPLSTAEEGIDFAPFLSTNVVIPPGQNSVQLPIEIFNDNIDENLEALILELDIPCACYSDTAQLFLSDAPPLLMELPDLSVCADQSNTLSPIIEGGVPPFSYNWSSGTNMSTIEAASDGPSSYQVTITDACGSTSVDSNQISITEMPTASLSGYADICEGDTAQLLLHFTGVAPWHFTLSRNGEIDTTYTKVTANPFSFPVTEGGTFEVLYFEDGACAGEAAGWGIIDMAPIIVDAEIQAVSCFSGQDGSINITVGGGVAPLEWQWSSGESNVFKQEQLGAGPISLELEDAKGCSKTAYFLITEPPELEPLQVNCTALAAGTFDFATNGGTPPYQYSINGANFWDASNFENIAGGQWHNLHTQDANGCQISQPFFMPEVVPEIILLPSRMEVKFGETIQLQPLLQVPEEQITNIRWITSATLDCTDCLTPSFLALQPEQFLLKIQDINGCSFEYPLKLEVKVEADYFVPNAFSPNDDGINDRLVLFANTYQVKEVLHFQVFDRWGGSCFVQRNFPPNAEQFGWDGNCKGQAMSNGIYVFMGQLLLADGQEVWIKGSTLLIK